MKIVEKLFPCMNELKIASDQHRESICEMVRACDRLIDVRTPPPKFPELKGNAIVNPR